MRCSLPAWAVGALAPAVEVFPVGLAIALLQAGGCSKDGLFDRAQRPRFALVSTPRGYTLAPRLTDRHVMRLPGPVRVLRPSGTDECPLVVAGYRPSPLALTAYHLLDRVAFTYSEGVYRSRVRLKRRSPNRG